MRAVITRFLKDQSGATAVEYGLIAALIAVVIIGGATAVGIAINDKLNGLGTTVNNAGGG